MKCPGCDHAIDMHRIGFLPRDAGCMVREPLGTSKPRWCWCALTPDEARKRAVAVESATGATVS